MQHSRLPTYTVISFVLAKPIAYRIVVRTLHDRGEHKALARIVVRSARKDSAAFTESLQGRRV